MSYYNFNNVSINVVLGFTVGTYINLKGNHY